MALKNTSLKKSLTHATMGMAGNTSFDGLATTLNMIDGSLVLLSTIAKCWITGWLIERWTQGSFFPMGFFNVPCVVCGLLMLWLVLRFKRTLFSFFMVCAGINLWLTYLPIQDLPPYLPCLESDIRSSSSSPYPHLYPIF
jgi:hypothetical protein